MARSVSYPRSSAWVAYLDLDGLAEDSDQWMDFTNDLTSFMIYGFDKTIKGFRSMSPCSEYLGREDHALLENSHAWIGVSTYCSLASVWCVPKDPGNALASNWCAQIEDRAREILQKAFSDNLLVPLGRASNGEQFFHLQKDPNSCVTSKEGRLW